MKFEIVSPKETIQTFEIKVNRELIDGILETVYMVNTLQNAPKEPSLSEKQNTVLEYIKAKCEATLEAFDYAKDKPTAHRLNAFKLKLESLAEEVPRIFKALIRVNNETPK